MKNKLKENKIIIQESKEFKLFAVQSHPEAIYIFVAGIFTSEKVQHLALLHQLKHRSVHITNGF